MKIINLIKKKKYILFILTAYLISYGLIIFNKGVFWDDWVWINRDFSFYKGISDQMGSEWSYLWTNFMYTHITLAKVLVFIFNLITTYLFYKIIIKHFNPFETFILVLFFAIMPINYVRSMLNISMYSLCLMLFYIGFYLVEKNLEKNRIIIRIISYLFFLLSFNMSSLLFFYLVVALYVWWKKYNFKKFGKVLVYNFDYILLPIIYFIFKRLYYIPYGLYDSYNSFSLSTLVKSPVYLGLSIYEFTFDLLQLVVSQAFQSSLLLLFIIIIFIFLKNEDIKKLNWNKNVFYVSIVLVIIGLVPYLLVGKIPSLIDYNNRHSILLGAGLTFLSFTSCALMIRHLNKNSSLVLLSFVIASLVIFNVNTSKEFLLYSYKLDSILYHFKNNDVIRDNTTFIFEDTEQKNESNILTNTPLSFYVFNGMLNSAYGDETRFMVPKISQYEIGKMWIKTATHLRAADWIPSEIQYKILLIKERDISKSDIIRLIVYSFLDKDKYTLLIKGLYRLESEKIEIKNQYEE